MSHLKIGSPGPKALQTRPSFESKAQVVSKPKASQEGASLVRPQVRDGFDSGLRSKPLRRPSGTDRFESVRGGLSPRVAPKPLALSKNLEQYKGTLESISSRAAADTSLSNPGKLRRAITDMVRSETGLKGGALQDAVRWTQRDALCKAYGGSDIRILAGD
jgi:hypothetical protein